MIVIIVVYFKKLKLQNSEIKEAKMKFDTLAVHGGQYQDKTLSRGIPIYKTTAYLFKDTEHAAKLFSLEEDGNIYARIMNPTTTILEERVTKLEGGKASLALSSGTSAVFYSIINIARNGDEIISSNKLYGGTHTMFDSILPNMGITTKFFDPNNPKSIEPLVNDKTKLIYIETISNPTLDVSPIGEISEIAKKYHLPLVVDATFTTPYLLRTIDYGANIVINSLSKWMGGHGAGIGGIVTDCGNFDWNDKRFPLYSEPDPNYHGMIWAKDLNKEKKDIAFVLRMRTVLLRNLGACLSPDDAWLFTLGLETLSVRMDRHSSNAKKVADYLKNNKKVEWVRYPGLNDDPAYPIASKYMKNGFGGMVVFGIKGGADAGRNFINKLKLFSHVANVGDTKSTATHPATTTHSQMSEEELIQTGINSNFVRLSIGIEDIDDIIADLEQAL